MFSYGYVSEFTIDKPQTYWRGNFVPDSINTPMIYILANAVLKLYHLPAKDRKEMGIKGRRYFEKNFERKMLLDRLESWIRVDCNKRFIFKKYDRKQNSNK